MRERSGAILFIRFVKQPGEFAPSGCAFAPHPEGNGGKPDQCASEHEIGHGGFFDGTREVEYGRGHNE